MTGDPHTLVCFDLGGVVVRICRDWVEGCAAAGIDVREPERFSRPELKAQRRKLSHEYQCGVINCDQFFAGVADSTDGLYLAEEIRLVHDAWITGEYPGVLDLVRELNALDPVRTACLSNTNHAHWQGMLAGEAYRSPALCELETRIASQEIGHVKPFESAYRETERITDTPGDRIVFFDDTEENITAARSFGWRAHLIDYSGDTAAQMRAILARECVLSAR